MEIEFHQIQHDGKHVFERKPYPIRGIPCVQPYNPKNSKQQIYLLACEKHKGEDKKNTSIQNFKEMYNKVNDYKELHKENFVKEQQREGNL